MFNSVIRVGGRRRRRLCSAMSLGWEEKEVVFSSVIRVGREEKKVVFSSVVRVAGKEKEVVFSSVIRVGGKEEEVVFSSVIRVGGEEEVVFSSVIRVGGEDEELPKESFRLDSLINYSLIFLMQIFLFTEASYQWSTLSNSIFYVSIVYQSAKYRSLIAAKPMCSVS